jgi:NitT/TauT family transport system permease protein
MNHRSMRAQRRHLFVALRKREILLVKAASLTTLIAFWATVSAFHLAPGIFLPSPWRIADSFWSLLWDGGLFRDAYASTVRVLVGFLLSTACALPLGIIAGVFPKAEAAIEPPVSFIRYMPVAAFVPLTMIWVGVDEGQKYLLIWIGTFFSQVLMFIDTIKRVPRALVNVGYTLGFSEVKILRRIVLPWCAPRIWDAMRVTLGWAWSWLVLAEVVSASTGLGHRIILGQRYLKTAEIFDVIILIGVIGLALDQSTKVLGRALFPWSTGRAEQEG